MLRLSVLGLLALLAWHLLTLRTMGPSSRLTLHLVQSPSGQWVAPGALEHPEQSPGRLTVSLTVRGYSTPLGVCSAVEAEGNSSDTPSGHTQDESSYGGLHSYIGPSRAFWTHYQTWLDCLKAQDAQAATIQGAPLTWSQQRDIVDDFSNYRGIIYHGLLFRIFFQWGWAIGIPLWSAAAFISIRHVVRLWSASKTFMALRAGRCPNCHYATAGLDPHALCPECGTDPNEYRRKKIALLAKDKGDPG